MFVTMPHWKCRWALPCFMLLLLLGSQLLGTNSWSSQEERDSSEQKDMESHFPATIEYALHIYNLQSKDLKAYRLVIILNACKEEVEDRLAFSMELELHRTKCGKSDDNIDNCPFQETSVFHHSPSTFHLCLFPWTLNCFFSIGTMPWETTFKLLYNDCLEGIH
uniref:Cystatin domain-containing protein n=1 Tax=Suricata suricatta TaxID=37032 RepID=A0A673TPM1_SURSU